MKRVLLCLLVVAGCGDDDAADAGGDVGMDAAIDVASDASRDTVEDITRDASPDVDASDTSSDTNARMETLAEIEARLLGSDLSAALADAACAGDLPFIRDGQALVIYRGEGGRVSVAGDGNDWDPDSAPMREAREGVFFARVPFTAGKFKVVVDGAFLPPESARFGFDDFGEHGWMSGPADVHFARCDLETRSGRRRVQVRVPATRSERARVLLLHDGQNVFGDDAPFGGWRVEVALADAFDDVLAVGVFPKSRFDEYTHVPDARGEVRAAGGADAYLDEVFDEVLPFVRSRFGVGAEAARVAMMGSSLGGLVTAYAAMVRAEHLGCAMAMSPSLGWGAYSGEPTRALVHQVEAPLEVPIYLDSGGGGTCVDVDGDGVMEDADDSDLYCVTNQFRDRLDAAGHTFGVDLFHWHEPGAAHNEAAWRARVPRALSSCEAAGWTR